MKKLFLLLVGVCLLTACGKDPSLTDGSDHTYRSKFYTVGEARASYERACETASRAETGSVLMPGDYIVDWDGVQISIAATLYSADVPIELAYDFYRYLEIEGEVYWIPLYPKLVTVTPPDKEHSSVYIRYYVPHEYYEWAHDPEVYDELLNSLPKQDFTGLSLYTTLGGDPVCVARYEEGRLEACGFLYEKGRTVEENAEVMTEILDGLRVGRTAKSGVSRGTETNDGYPIEEVVVIGVRPKPEQKKDEADPFEDWHVLPVPNMDGGGSSGGGGGGGSGTGSGEGNGDDNGNSESSEKSYEYNEKIKYEDEETVKPLLDSIFQDCMGSTLIESLGDVTIETNAGKYSYDYETNTIQLKYDLVHGYQDYLFLEELIHAYQFQNQTNAIQRALNNEVEAKVGWLLYRERKNNPLSAELMKQAFGIVQVQNAFVYLSQYYSLGVSHTNEHYVNRYNIAIGGIGVHPSYYGYQTDDSVNAMEFKVLIELMINCPEL